MSTKVIVRHTVAPRTNPPSRTVTYNTVYRMNKDGSITQTRKRSVTKNVTTG